MTAALGWSVRLDRFVGGGADRNLDHVANSGLQRRMTTAIGSHFDLEMQTRELTMAAIVRFYVCEFPHPSRHRDENRDAERVVFAIAYVAAMDLERAYQGGALSDG
jgi:hypothetical protein